MRTLHKTLVTLALTVAALFTTACHDHDDLCSDAADNTPVVNNDLTAEALHRLLWEVTDLDTLPSNWASSSYTVEPNYGEAYDKSTPYVRYVTAESRQEAIDLFTTITGQDNDNYATTWSRDSIGTITLNADSTESLYGRILFNVQQLPSLTEIRFVPKSALGTNANDNWTPHYHYGDIIQIKNIKDNTTEQWICIRGEYNNNKKHKEFTYWACFTMGADNIGTINYQNTAYTYPKNLGGNEEDLATLPKLLQIIVAPREAYNEWKTEKTANARKYGRYNFLGEPFTDADYTESDFVDIYNTLASGTTVKKLIPGWEGIKTSVASAVINKAPLTLIMHGPKTSGVLKAAFPITFKNCVTYTGDFYAKTQNTSFTYNPTGLLEPPLTTEELEYHTADEQISALKNLVAGDASYLLVRMRRSDKFKEIISNPKNYGKKFTSKNETKYEVTDLVQVPYNDNHAKQSSLPFDEPFCVGDVATAGDGDEQTTDVCVASDENYELFIEPVDDAGYIIYTSEYKAFSALLNVLNGYICNKGGLSTTLYNAVYSKLGVTADNWAAYTNAVGKLMTKSNEQFQKQGKKISIAGAFYLKDSDPNKTDEGTISASMPCKNANHTNETLTLTYDKQTHNYTIEFKEINKNNYNPYYFDVYEHNPASDYDELTRVYNVETNLTRRENIAKTIPSILSSEKLGKYLGGYRIEDLYRK